MSGDWIKMRIDLQTHPKIVRILSATKADKFRVIGGLHAVWCVFDTHSKDGSLHGYTPETLDHIIGWEGFSDAMIAVKWLMFDGLETLTVPEFDEHNGASGKRRAEDQKRKRESRKNPQEIHNLSDSNADKMRTESGLEKRREENTKNIAPSAQKFSALRFLIEKGIEENIAKDWLAVRKLKKLAPTETALVDVFSQIVKTNLLPNEVIKICCVKGWGGFKASWPLNENQPQSEINHFQ